MELLHFSAINEAYHKGILRSWEDGGCMEEINDRMGYRLSLTSADFNEQVRAGAEDTQILRSIWRTQALLPLSISVICM